MSLHKVNYWLIGAFLWFFINGCKKEKNTPAPTNQINSPTIALNGWSYHGQARILYYSEDNKYQLYLCKVHEHSGGVIDVFYGTRYTMLNTNGLITTGSARWLLKRADGSLVRNTNDYVSEFNQNAGFLFLGQHTEHNVPPIDVQVFGSSAGEFKAYNPMQIAKNLMAPNGMLVSGWENQSGSESPRSICTSLISHFIEPNIKVDVSDIYWHGYTAALGKNPTTGQYFILTYYRDSSFVMLNAVSPQNFSTNYGTMRKLQPLMGKRIKEIIPSWSNTLSNMDVWPLYYQYSAEPSSIYFILQDQSKIYVIKVELNNFQFSLVHEYAQPRNSTAFNINEIFSIQFIDKDPGTFLFHERRQSGLYALLFKNGSTQQITMPQFKPTVVHTVTSLRYDNNKYWLIVADKDKNIHLFSKSY